MSKVINQSGFAHTGLIILAVVVLLIATGGWFVYDRNKVENAEPSIVAEQSEPNGVKKEDTESEQLTTIKLPEFGVSLSVPSGWSVREEDSYDVGYLIYNETKNLTIIASISTSPVGFSGCESTDDLILAKVSTLKATSLKDVVVLGVDGSAPSLAKTNLKLGTKERQLVGSPITVADATEGTEFYYCPSANPPYGWSVNFDKNTGTQDQIAVAISKPTDIEKKASAYPEYNELVEILSTATSL